MMPRTYRVNKRKIIGFTLLEIMIALFIFSIVGVMMSIGLNLVVKTEQRLDAKHRVLTDLQLALMIMKRDIEQIINRPIVNEKGQTIPAIIFSNNQLEFTHSGFINPNYLKQRSSLQRVLYKLDGNRLLRITWNALDRSEATRQYIQVLLTDVYALSFQLLPSNMDLSKLSQLPSINFGIKIEMRISELGKVERIIPIAKTIFNETTYA